MELYPKVGIQFEREVLCFLHSDKPMISINKGRHENFRDFKYYKELSNYPHLDIDGLVPQFFKTNEIKQEYIKYFDNRFGYDRKESDVKYGNLLGYPPSASHALFYERREKENRIWVDYYGLMFATILSSIPADIKWVEERYAFPDELKTWITIRHENPEYKIVNGIKTLDSKYLVYSHSSEILKKIEKKNLIKFSTNKNDIFKDWELI